MANTLDYTVDGFGGIKEEHGLALSDETSDLVADTAVGSMRIGYAFEITAVRAAVSTAPTGATLIIDINLTGTGTIMTTNKLSIDVSEKTSITAATAAGLTTTTLAADDELTFDIDQIGSSVAGTGLKVWIQGYRI